MIRTVSVLSAALVAIGVCGQATRAATVSSSTVPLVATGHPFLVGSVHGSASSLLVTDTAVGTSTTVDISPLGGPRSMTSSRDGRHVAFAFMTRANAVTSGVAVLDVATGTTTVVVSHRESEQIGAAEPTIDPTGTTVSWVEEDFGQTPSTTVRSAPLDGSAASTEVPVSTSGHIAYAPGGALLYTPASSGGGCAIAEHPRSGSDDCALTSAQLVAATGVPDASDGSTSSAITAIGTADGSLVPVTVEVASSTSARTTEIGVLDGAGGTLRLLPASAVSWSTVSTGLSYDAVTPTIDADDSEVIYELQYAPENSSVPPGFLDYSVDIASGQHRAPVGDANALGEGGIAAYTPHDLGQPSLYVPLGAPKRLLDTRSGTGAPKAALGSGSSVDVAVAGGSTGVASNATAVVLNVTGTNPTAATYLQAYPTPAGAAPPPLVSTVNLGRGQTAANAATVSVGSAGKVRLTNANGTVDVIADVTGYYVPLSGAGSTAASFTALATPSRQVDTRDGTGVAKGALGPASARDWTVPTSVVPAGATSVVLNVTAVANTAATFVTAFPAPASGSSAPTTSTLNLARGETRANLATVTLPSSRRIRLYNSVGSTSVVIDVVGYDVPGLGGSAFVPLPPVRVFDTRFGVNSVGGRAQPVGPQAVADLRAAGSITAGVGHAAVAPGATAVAVNVTATDGTTQTFLSLYATGDGPVGPPSFSTVNVARSTVVPNAAITAVGSARQVQVYNAAGSVGVVVDLAGYFEPVPLT